MRLIIFIMILASNAYSEHVAIQWTWDENRELGSVLRSEFLEQWKDSCKEIGELVKPGKGPYGWGIFDSFTCFTEDQKSTGPGNKKTRWLMKFHHHKEGLTLTLNAVPLNAIASLPNPTGEPLASVTIEHMSDIEEIVGSEEFLPLLLATMWDQAPFLRTLKPKKTKYRRMIGPSPPIVDPFPLPPAPANLRVFKMLGMTPGGYWVGEPMELGILESADVKYLHSGRSRSRSIWNFQNPFKVEKKVWVHHDKGTLVMQKELQKRLKEAVDVIQDIGLVGAIAEALSMTVTSGYFGFRYGKSLITQQFFLDNMAIMSLLFEIRAGPLQGIKFFADAWPSFSLESGVEFGGNRQVFGWSFGMDAGPVYVDLTPTFGRWSVHMRLPVETEQITINESTGVETVTTNTQVLPLDLSNALSVGIEVGTELQYPSHLYRFGYSQAYALPMNGQTARVNTSRYAIDTFHELPVFDDVESSLLLFFLTEFASFSDSSVTQTNQTQETTVEVDSTDVETPQVDNKIEDVTFVFIFAGLGVTFSW